MLDSNDQYELHSLKSLRWRVREAIQGLASRPAKQSLPDCLVSAFFHISAIPASWFPEKARSYFEDLSVLMVAEHESIAGEGTLRAAARTMRMSGFRKARKAAELICRIEIAVTDRIEELLVGIGSD